jgi:hypothetical protein
MGIGTFGSSPGQRAFRDDVRFDADERQWEFLSRVSLQQYRPRWCIEPEAWNVELVEIDSHVQLANAADMTTDATRV